MKKVLWVGSLVAVAAAAIYAAGRARAAEIPAVTPMTYSGVLTDMSGAPLSGTKNIQVQFWDMATAGAVQCTVTSTGQMLNAGSFQITLPDDCTGVVHNKSDVWVEVSVDGASLGRTKLGAVPYAVEADEARQATTATTAIDAIGDIHPTSVTVSGAVTANGLVSLKGGVDLSSRVTKTVPTTGSNFATQTISGVNLCPATFHPCTSWEAMVLDELSSTAVFDAPGWVVGSFPNIDIHLRSLVNGQDSTVCPAGNYLIKFPSKFTHVGITSTGGIHCAAATGSNPVWCCKDKS